jgi:hypothetical protein
MDLKSRAMGRATDSKDFFTLYCKMYYQICALALLTVFLPAVPAVILAAPTLMINGITFQTRAHWMSQANEALSQVSGSPCPFAAFGTAIVNHTASGTGELICLGVNENGKTGNPSLHGAIIIKSIFTHKKPY